MVIIRVVLILAVMPTRTSCYAPPTYLSASIYIRPVVPRPVVYMFCRCHALVRGVRTFLFYVIFRFYSAEVILALLFLHNIGIIYRYKQCGCVCVSLPAGHLNCFFQHITCLVPMNNELNLYSYQRPVTLKFLAILCGCAYILL